MSTDIYIGIDGGASKSKARIEDVSGKLLGQGSSGASNLKLPAEQSWQTIMEATQQAMQEAQLSFDDPQYKFHLGLGLSGCELPEACKSFLAKTPPFFATTHLKSDAYAACLGAHDGRDGAIIIIGTGTVSVQIQKGKTVQVGGWGFPHGDEGSGAWLGLEAVRLALQWLDGRFEAEVTPLLEAIFSKFDNDLTKLVVWANSSNSNGFAQIAPLVIEHIESKDPIALMLIQRAAKEIDRIGMVLTKYTEGGQTLPCALFGGLAPFVQPWLSDELKARIVPRKHDATVGAILMIKQELEK